MSHIVSTRRITQIQEDSTGPDYQSVEYRLNNRKRMSEVGANSSRTFAIELDNGAMIRVIVAQHQADRFEQELSTAIEQNPNSDVGSILYELTRYFDIYDMQWSGQFDDTVPVREDDEQPAPQVSDAPADPDAVDVETDSAIDDPDAGNGGEDGMFDDNTTVDLDAIDDVDAMDGDNASTDSTDLATVLQTLVTQLTADSEARKSEAEAKKAEAEAKKAEAVARALEIRVKQDAEVKEMEEWEAGEKEKQKKQKELDRLAKFRLAQKQGLVDSFKTIEDVDSQYIRAADGNTQVRGRFVAEAAPAPQMQKHVRAVNAAVKARPQNNPAALDNLEDAALDMLADLSAQRAQSLRDITQARQAGASNEAIQSERKAADIRQQFTRGITRLRDRMEAQLKQVGAK